ncbi:MAG: hypothetical protein ACO3RV_06730 [Luteolibacter sp.]
MKNAIKLGISAIAMLGTACTQLTNGPVGSWRGMDGTDVIKLRLDNSGKCQLDTPGQQLTGTWKLTGPGKAMVYVYESGQFKMKNDNQAQFTFNQRMINMNRIAESAPVVKPKSTPVSKPAPKTEVPRRESYHLNEIP